MKKWPIIIVQNSIKTVFTFRLPYIKELIDNGYSVVVIAPNDCQSSRRDLIDLGVRVPFVKCGHALFLWLQINFHLLKERNRCGKKSLIICHFLVTALLSFPMIALFNKRMLSIEGLGSLFSGRPNLIRGLRYFVRVFFEKRLFTNATENKLLGQGAGDKVFGGIGIDVEKFFYAEENYHSSQVRCLYVGRLLEDKGVEDCFEVAFLLMRQGIDVRLDVVGDIYSSNPSSLSNDRLLEVERQSGGRIKFHGYCSDVRPFYKNADVLLLLSRCEGFPVVVMEASASGVPSVAYRVPGCEDAICEGKNGFLVDYKDINAVVNLIKTSAFHGVSSSCRAYALANFDVRGISHRFVGEVEDLWKKNAH